MTTEALSRDDAFELELVRQDLLCDVLFLVGTIISIYQNKKAEQEIISPEENQPSAMIVAPSDNLPFGFGLVVLVLFLAGTSILAFGAIARLNKQKAEAGNNADQTTVNNIKGGEIVIGGQLVRIIGYIISILGQKIRIANPV